MPVAEETATRWYVLRLQRSRGDDESGPEATIPFAGQRQCPPVFAAPGRFRAPAVLRVRGQVAGIYGPATAVPYAAGAPLPWGPVRHVPPELSVATVSVPAGRQCTGPAGCGPASGPLSACGRRPAMPSGFGGRALIPAFSIILPSHREDGTDYRLR